MQSRNFSTNSFFVLVNFHTSGVEIVLSYLDLVESFVTWINLMTLSYLFEFIKALFWVPSLIEVWILFFIVIHKRTHLCPFCRRRLWIHCLRSVQSNLELGEHCHLKGTCTDLWNGQKLCVFKGNGGFWSNAWKFLLLWTSSQKHLTRIWVNNWSA